MGEVEDWLEAHTFRCERLRARLTVEQCRERQRQAVHFVSCFRLKLAVGMPSNIYCASGECAEGRRNR
jgi:hypothetical protein